METVSEIERLNQQVLDLENELKTTKSEVETLTHKLGNVERKHEKSLAYSDELRAELESLRAELHAYRHASRSRTDVGVQVDLPRGDGCVHCGHNKPAGEVSHGVGGDSADPAAWAMTTSSVTTSEPAISEETAMPTWTASDPSIATESDGVSIADSLKAAAEEALQQSGVVYDEGSGMYYDYNTGYYHDPDRSLYYEPKSGTYYHYNHETQTYEFHSQVDLSQYTAQPGHSQHQPTNHDTLPARPGRNAHAADCENIDKENKDEKKHSKHKHHKKKTRRDKSAQDIKSQSKRSERSSRKDRLSGDEHSKKEDKRKHHKKKHKHKEKDEESLRKKLKKAKEKKKKRKDKKECEKADSKMETDENIENTEQEPMEDATAFANSQQPISSKEEVQGEGQRSDHDKHVTVTSCSAGDDDSVEGPLNAQNVNTKMSVSQMLTGNSDDLGKEEHGCDQHDLKDEAGRKALEHVQKEASDLEKEMSDLEEGEHVSDTEELEKQTIDLEEGELSDSSQSSQSFSSSSSSSLESKSELSVTDDESSDGGAVEVDQTNSAAVKPDIFNEECARFYPPCIRAMVTASDCVDVGTLFIVTCTGATIGREKSLGHAILVPDLQVSKMHADIKYNEEIKKYVIQDHASQNGTVLNGKRISEPKVMSDLFPLTNGDVLRLGGTELELHIHPGTDTCDGCEPGQVRARLQLTEKANQEKVSEPVLTKAQREALRRKQLKNIKRKYGLQNCSYVDNAAALKNPSYQDKSGERRRTKGSDNPYQKDDLPASVERAITVDNKGHKLMQKMGWKEGDSLGKSQEGIREPIRIQMRARQSAGLGSAGDIGHSLDNVTGVAKTERWIKTRERFDRTETVAKTTNTSITVLDQPAAAAAKPKLAAPAWVKGEVLEPEGDDNIS